MVRPIRTVLTALLVSLSTARAGAAQPLIVVYPFAISGNTPDNTGSRLVDRIAAEITALGGITVIRGSDATKPEDFRSAARAAGADVYYSGSIVPVGAGYSAIEHLVSTRSGTVMWSTTMQFREISDVRGEGERIRDELLRGATPAPATPAPAPAVPAAGASPSAPPVKN